MKKGWRLGLTVLVLALLMMLGVPGTAEASSSTTPKALRGTWYEYTEYDHGYQVTKIYRHSAIVYHLNKDNRRPKRTVFKTSSRGFHKLQVTKYLRGYGGTVYQLNKSRVQARALPLMWIGHREINGKNYRVLKSYLHQDIFHVALKHKMAYAGTYIFHGKNYRAQIGR